MKVRGIIPALVTPLTDDERVDEDGMRRVVQHNLAADVHGLFVLGSMGAFDLLEDEEQVRAVEIVLDEVNGKVPVIAGASDTGTTRVIERAQRLAHLDLDYLSILPPYFGFFTQEEITHFYWQLTDAIEIPIFVYNNPVMTKNTLELRTIMELSEISGIAGIKDSSEDIAYYERLGKFFQNNDDFTYLAGTENLVLTALKFGADGAVGGIQSLAPALAVTIWRNFEEGNYGLALEAQARLTSLLRIIKYGNIWGGVEAAFRILGLCNKITASPHLSIEDEGQYREIEKILEECLP